MARASRTNLFEGGTKKKFPKHGEIQGVYVYGNLRKTEGSPTPTKRKTRKRTKQMLPLYGKSGRTLTKRKIRKIAKRMFPLYEKFEV